MGYQKVLELGVSPRTRIVTPGQEDRIRGLALESELIEVAGRPCPELDRLVEVARTQRGTVPNYPWPARSKPGKASKEFIEWNS